MAGLHDVSSRVSGFAGQNGGAAREHEVEALAPLGDLDAQRRRARAMEADADADVAFQSIEAEIVPARHDLARVVEHGHVEAAAAGNPAELAGEQQAVAIAESPAGIAAQRAAAAERRQQEIGHRILVAENRLHQTAAK